MKNIKILIGIGLLFSCLNYSNCHFERGNDYFYEKPNIV